MYVPCLAQLFAKRKSHKQSAMHSTRIMSIMFSSFGKLKCLLLGSLVVVLFTVLYMWATKHNGMALCDIAQAFVVTLPVIQYLPLATR